MYKSRLHSPFIAAREKFNNSKTNTRSVSLGKARDARSNPYATKSKTKDSCEHRKRSVGKKGRKRRGHSMGRYPFLTYTEKYLREARARLAESTIKEQKRKLRYLNRVIGRLKAEGKITTTNPSKFLEQDYLEFVVWMKEKKLDNNTQRKYLGLLKAVSRSCGNTTIDKMIADKKIVIHTTYKEPRSHTVAEVQHLLECTKKMPGWNGYVTRFFVAMYVFLELRPKELRLACMKDLDTGNWTFWIGNPKGEGWYGQQKNKGIPEVAKPYILEFLKRREQYLKGKGIAQCEPLIPNITKDGAKFYTAQCFCRYRDELKKVSGIDFKIKDLRPTGAQIALDHGASIEAVSRDMRHSSTKTTELYYARIKDASAFKQVNNAFNDAFRNLQKTSTKDEKYISGYA